VTAAPQIEEQRYGWVMVAVIFCFSILAFGGMSSVAVFIKPLTLEFGWTRAETSLGYTVNALSAALVGLLVGVYADRFGTRLIAFIAAAGMGSAYLLQAGLTTLTEHYAYYILYGATGLTVVAGPMLIGVGFWFGRNKGLAIGIVAAGGALGQAIVPVVFQTLIDTFNWRDAFFYMGVAYLVIGLPLALLVRDPPIRNEARAVRHQSASTPQTSALTQSVTGLRSTEVILWLSTAIFFCCTCMAVLIVHLVPLMTDRGIDSATAVQLLMVLMIAGAAGRLLGGKFADIVGVLPAFVIMSAFQTSVIYWFVVTDWMPVIWVLTVLFGLAFSGVMVSIITSAREFIPPVIGARGMAMVGLFGWGGMGFGGYIGGQGYDWTGDYQLSFALSVGAGLLNIIILLAFASRIRRHGSMKLWGRPAGSLNTIQPRESAVH